MFLDWHNQVTLNSFRETLAVLNFAVMTHLVTTLVSCLLWRSCSPTSSQQWRTSRRRLRPSVFLTATILSSTEESATAWVIKTLQTQHMMHQNNQLQNIRLLRYQPQIHFSILYVLCGKLFFKTKKSHNNKKTNNWLRQQWTSNSCALCGKITVLNKLCWFSRITLEQIINKVNKCNVLMLRYIMFFFVHWCTIGVAVSNFFASSVWSWITTEYTFSKFRVFSWQYYSEFIVTDSRQDSNAGSVGLAFVEWFKCLVFARSQVASVWAW